MSLKARRKRSARSNNTGGSPTLPILFSLKNQSTVVPEKGPAATFTRATAATVEDLDGLVKTCLSGEVRFKGARRVHNLVDTTSEDWTDAAWTKTTMTTTATSLTAAGGNSTVLQTYTGTGDFRLRVKLSRVTGSGNVDLTIDNSSFTTVTLTGTDSVFSMAATGVTNPTFGVRLVTDGDSINADEIQLERTDGQTVTTSSEYISVGVESSPFFGAMVDAVKYFTYKNGNTVDGSNNLTEADGAAIGAGESHADASGPYGYLAEGQRQNICLQASVMENAAWVATTTTKSDNDVASPAGTTTGATLTATGANSTVIQDLGVIASAAKAYAVWMKRKTGTGDVELTLDGGSTWTTKTLTSSWVRFEITQTLANPDVGIRIVTSGDAIYVWNNQVEAAAFASSDIETVGTAVTRNQDSLSYAKANIQKDSQGTFFCEITTEWGDGVAGTKVIMSGTGASEGSLMGFNKSTTFRDGTNTSTSPTGTSAFNNIIGVAGTWGGGGLISYWDGSGDLTPASYDGTLLTGTDVFMGLRGGSASELYGTMRNVLFYTARLNPSAIAGLP